MLEDKNALIPSRNRRIRSAEDVPLKRRRYLLEARVRDATTYPIRDALSLMAHWNVADDEAWSDPDEPQSP